MKKKTTKSILGALTAQYCEEQLGRQYQLKMDGEKFKVVVLFFQRIFRQALKDGGVDESRAGNILAQVEDLRCKHTDELKRAVADTYDK